MFGTKTRFNTKVEVENKKQTWGKEQNMEAVPEREKALRKGHQIFFLLTRQKAKKVDRGQMVLCVNRIGVKMNRTKLACIKLLHTGMMQGRSIRIDLP